MSHSTYETFVAHAQSPLRSAKASARVVPVWREIVLDSDTPVSAYAKLRRGPFGFLLESAPAGGETWSRYTYLGTEPSSAWRLRGHNVDLWDPEGGWHSPRKLDDPLADLDDLVS